MRRITVRGFFKWLSLGLFLTCSAIILAESAVDGTSSADKSDAITNIVQGVIDSNHDSNTIVDIHDFNLSFNNEQYKVTYNPGDILTYETVFEPSNTSFIGLNITSSNEEIAKMVGEFIHCTNIQEEEINTEEEVENASANVDFTVILGRDFNGRYVIPSSK